MVGLDTSHCSAFTELLNNENSSHHIEGALIVVAYPGGSQAFSLSRDRVKQIASEIRILYGRDCFDNTHQEVLNSLGLSEDVLTKIYSKNALRMVPLND